MHTAQCQMLQKLHAALKRARGSTLTLTQTHSDPPPVATQPESTPDQGTHQQPLPVLPSSCITPSAPAQGSQQQPLPSSDLLSITPLSSHPWGYSGDPWADGLALFGDPAADDAGAMLPQTHSGTGMQIPLQGVIACGVSLHSTNVLSAAHGSIV